MGELYCKYYFSLKGFILFIQGTEVVSGWLLLVGTVAKVGYFPRFQLMSRVILFMDGRYVQSPLSWGVLENPQVAWINRQPWDNDILMIRCIFSAIGSQFSVAIWVMILLLPASAEAYHLPRWEWGLGVAGLYVPAYRGAKGHESYLLPIPFFAYRSEILRMDEEGMRGLLFESNRIRLDLSLAGNLPVPEDSDSARSEMPDLDPIGEIGPKLDLSLVHNGEPHQGELNIWLQMPVRAAFSVGDPLIAQQGWVFSPNVDISYRKGAIRSYWKVSMSFGPLYATRRYHEYFYEVTTPYVTVDRPRYQPEGGYSGSRAMLTVAMNSRHWFMGAFVRYDQLDGAVFENSPLVETKQYFAVGFAVSRILGASGEMASH